MSLDPFVSAAVQFEPRMFAKQDNIAQLMLWVESAAKNGAKLITTPEMATTGYCWFDREEIAPMVETVPGPSTDKFGEIAKRYQCYIVLGMPEIDLNTQLYYNSAVLIGPDGVVGCHRKSHPYISEPKWAAAGDVGHQVFDTEIGRIGMLVCMDIHFPETARLLSLAGADIICHISNWLAERTPAPYWISRAMENGCYLIESNRWGLERGVQFSGGSCIIEPDGKITATLDKGDGVVYGEIDLARTQCKTVLGHTLASLRKPAIYQTLLSDSFLWNPHDFFSLYGHRPLPAGKTSVISVAQFSPSSQVAENLQRIQDIAENAVSYQRSELIVFPELALTGTTTPVENAQSLDGQAIATLITLAMRLRVYLVIGFAEVESGQYFNSQVLVGPEGLIGSYRQIHLSADIQRWASEGQEFKYYDIPAGRIGLLLGQDALLPESCRILALKGCDIIACSGNIPSGFTASHSGSTISQNYPIPTGADPLHWHLFRTRAGENNVYMAFANTLSNNGSGGGFSGVFGPDTFSFPRQEQVLFQQSACGSQVIDTTSLSASNYPTNIVRRKDLVTMRQPHHYKLLLTSDQ